MTTLTPTRSEDDVVVDDERMAARRAEVEAARAGRGRRVLRRLIMVVSGSALVAGLAAAAALSPWFAVGEVEVIGAEGISPDTIRSWSGIEAGQAVWAVDAAGVEERLEARPEIREARVDVRWPSTVEVRVATRSAIARLVPEGGGAVIVSSQGVVLEVEAPDSLALMSVRVPDLGDPDVGDSIDPDLAAAVDIAGQLPFPIALRVIAAHVDADGEIRLMGRAGVEIRLGDRRGIDAKLEAVERTLSGQVVESAMCLIDVRNPRSVVVRRDPDCDPPPPPSPPPVPVEAPALAPETPSPVEAVPAPSVTAVSPAAPFGGPGAPEPEVVVAEPDPAAPTPG